MVRGKEKMKDLLRTGDLTPDDLSLLLDLSAAFKRDPLGRDGLLRGGSVVLYFTKPSTRTRISLETAVARLGGLPISVGTHELQLGRGETIEDTARVIGSYARAFFIRTFADEDVEEFAAAAPIPVINALTDLHHPLQSVADMLTLRERFGDLRGLRLAYVGDGNNNVAHSLMEAAMLLGLDMALASPPSYEPSPDVTARARARAESTGGRLTLTHDPAEAVRGARAVYTDLWVSLGNADHERRARAAALAPYRVDAPLMAHADREAVFMHCLPAHRGEEVAVEVIDGPRSIVFPQAANRLPTGQAVLCALLEGRLAGARG
jgi:ornithine carbamoyltransferase